MSENTGGVPPRDPEDPHARRPADGHDPWEAPEPPQGSQPPPPEGSQPPPGSQPPAYGAYPPPAAGSPPPAYGQYAPEGWTPPPAGQDPYGGPAYGQAPDAGTVRVGTAFSWAWASFGRSAGAWIGATLVLGAIALAASWLLTPSLRDTVGNLGDPAALDAAVNTPVTTTEILLSAVASLVNTVLFALLVTGALAATRKGTASFGDFFALRNLPGVLVYGMITAAISFVLSFLPFLGGVLQLVVSFFLAAAIFFVIDKEQDAITAIRSSVRLVSRNLGTVLITVLLAVVVTFVGALLLVVGLLVAVPIAVLLGAHVYRRLVGEPVAPV